MSEWKDTTLGTLCVKIGSGATPTGGKSAYCDSGISLIRSQNVLDFSFSEDGLAYINDFQARKLDGVTVKENDVLLNITGDSVARVCIVPQEYLPARVNQHVAIIRPQKDIFDYAFCLYLLQKEKKKLLSLASTGGTRNALTKNMLEDYSVSIPSLPTQRRIAAILSSLDAKIENNNKVNAKLEEIAQNLFKEWFVDFGPFKDGKFVDSELGPIPEGWRVGTLGEIASNVTDGVHNSVKDDASSSYYLLSCKNIKGGKLTIDNKERTISEDTFKQLRKRTKLAKGDILLSSVGTIGEVMLLNENPTNYEFQRSVAIVKPKDGISSSEFIYETFVVRNVELRHLAHGAVQQCIFLSDLVNFNVLIPPYSIIEIFTNKSKSLFEKISLNYEENQRLATLRDTLLPKLMSGEIKV